jgi:ABC-type Na+ efflux pump permease subunit
MSPLGHAGVRKEILAASAPWLAACLNLLPGLGAGYIYQRRWRAYWLTALLASLWLLGDSLHASPDGVALAIGHPLPGLLGLATLTAMEAFLAARRARMN